MKIDHLKIIKLLKIFVFSFFIVSFIYRIYQLIKYGTMTKKFVLEDENEKLDYEG